MTDILKKILKKTTPTSQIRKRYWGIIINNFDFNRVDYVKETLGAQFVSAQKIRENNVDYNFIIIAFEKSKAFFTPIQQFKIDFGESTIEDYGYLMKISSCEDILNLREGLEITYGPITSGALKVDYRRKNSPNTKTGSVDMSNDVSTEPVFEFYNMMKEGSTLTDCFLEDKYNFIKYANVIKILYDDINENDEDSSSDQIIENNKKVIIRPFYNNGQEFKDDRKNFNIVKNKIDKEPAIQKCNSFIDLNLNKNIITIDEMKQRLEKIKKMKNI